MYKKKSINLGKLYQFYIASKLCLLQFFIRDNFYFIVLVSHCFDFMRKVNKKGPLVNSEFYPGWLTHWQESESIINSTAVVNQMKVMLAMNASFSFYMFHGGTNFGFTSGANTNNTNESIGYLPQLTSYDYNAPLDEAGDPTEKYFKIKETLKEAVSFYNCL